MPSHHHPGSQPRRARAQAHAHRAMTAHAVEGAARAWRTREDHHQLVIPGQLLVVRRLLRGEYAAAARRDWQLQRYQVRVRGHLGETLGPAAPSPNGLDPEPRREMRGLIEACATAG